MPFIKYETLNLRAATIELIEWAQATALDYRRRGYSLTIRQLYYQGVSRNRFPNNEKSYKNLINAVTKGRLMGMIDWALLEDRTRNAGGTAWFGHTMPDPWRLAENSTYGLTQDLWEGQENRVEIWVEKQALEQVASRAADQYRIPYLACKGYMSQSEMWEAGHRRLREYAAAGQHPVILHMGDHDPSGIDMTRDIEERLSLFAETPVEVRRLALNWDQIEQYNPPENPAKMSDSRSGDYVRRFGDSSWELDALTPELLVGILTSEIDKLIDRELYDQKDAEEDEIQEEARSRFARYQENQDAIDEFLDREGL